MGASVITQVNCAFKAYHLPLFTSSMIQRSFCQSVCLHFLTYVLNSPSTIYFQPSSTFYAVHSTLIN